MSAPIHRARRRAFPTCGTCHWVLPPLGYLLAAVLGVSALLMSLLSARRFELGRRRVLPVLGPVVILIAMEVVPHLINPCLVAGALGESLPPGCSRTVHGVDVHDRWHSLHHCRRRGTAGRDGLRGAAPTASARAVRSSGAPSPSAPVG
jgi:hypothetical protein